MAKRLNDHPLTDYELQQLAETLQNHDREDHESKWGWAILLYAAGIGFARAASGAGIDFWVATKWINDYEDVRA